jgi:hypothetical protein
MAAVEEAADVLQKWKYERVVTNEKNRSEIRRYRELLYTKWQNGQFVDFEYVVEGDALFGKSTPEKMRVGVGEELPFYTLYFGTHWVERRFAGGDGGGVKEVDPTGNRINIYVDNYNDETHSWLCDYKNRKIRSIKLSGLDKTEWTKNNDEDKDSRAINAEYARHSKLLDDVEYKYLHEQLTHIDFKLGEGLPSAVDDSRLNVLHQLVTKRMQKLRPPAKQTEQQRGGVGGLFGWSKPKESKYDKYSLDEIAHMGRLLQQLKLLSGPDMICDRAVSI